MCNTNTPVGESLGDRYEHVNTYKHTMSLADKGYCPNLVDKWEYIPGRQGGRQGFVFRECS